MKNQDLYQLFLEELTAMYGAEHLIIESLPNLIKLASLSDLKEALSSHLEETESQAERIEKIFSALDETVEEQTCRGMEGILKEVNKIVQNKAKSPVLDAAIIGAAQKVEHYEIASYGTLRSFANQLDLDSEIINLLQESLNEEAAADKKLTKIAEGSFFSSGVNKEAVDRNGARSRR